MVILSLDTTTRAGSCAVWRDGRVAEAVGDPAYTHAHRLPTDLANLLARQQLTLADVTLYAIASGPGSFTGLRVGIATMQALALVHDRQIVPITSLEAMAHAAARDDRAHAQAGAYVGAWLEAYRGEVFTALYRVRRAAAAAAGSTGEAAALAELESIVDPAVGTADEMAEAWTRAIAPEMHGAAQTSDASPPSMIVAGDAVEPQRAMLLARFPQARLRDAVPIAGTIATLAAREPQRAIAPHAVVPQYLRRPLAELTRERVLQQS